MVKNFTPTGLISGWKSILAFVVCALDSRDTPLPKAAAKPPTPS
jgi:hypothetical protein